MTLLSSLFRHTLGRVISSPAADNEGLQAKSRKRKIEEVDERETIARRRKREYSEDVPSEIITKRRRVGDEHYTAIVDGEEEYGSIAIEGEHFHFDSHANKITLVPPEALNTSKIKPLSKIIWEAGKRRTSLDTMETVSQRDGHPRMGGDLEDQYIMEKARRHAAATDLPPNSGMWERGEKELFFHLSYRGFEPLFPGNWMTDFRTMPLSLYHQPGDEEPPLIQHCKLSEFRAIRELQQLFNLGKNVRDKVLSSPRVRKEGIIEKAISKYITWAIKDIGVEVLSLKTRRSSKSNGLLPIHVVVRLKAHQTTTDCLFEMKNKLHDLAARHRRARNIHSSIERDELMYGTPNSNEETCVAESSEEDLPVLYGLMICKSVLAIFTMNSRTPPLPTSRGRGAELKNNRRNGQSPTPSESVAREPISSTEANVQTKKPVLLTELEEDYDPASDPRFISDFDFSDQAKDVWNALVIAIVAMQIRKDLLLHQQSTSEPRPNEILQQGIEHMDIEEISDDPDA